MPSEDEEADKAGQNGLPSPAAEEPHTKRHLEKCVINIWGLVDLLSNLNNSISFAKLILFQNTATERAHNRDVFKLLLIYLKTMNWQ